MEELKKLIDVWAIGPSASLALYLLISYASAFKALSRLAGLLIAAVTIPAIIVFFLSKGPPPRLVSSAGCLMASALAVLASPLFLAPLAVSAVSLYFSAKSVKFKVDLRALLLVMLLAFTMVPPAGLKYSGDIKVSFWIGLRNFSEEELSLLKQLNSSLYIFVAEWSEPLEQMLRVLEEHGIGAYLVPVPKGDFIHIYNYNDTWNLTLELAEAAREANVSLRGFVFDVEFPIWYAYKLAEASKEGDIATLAALQLTMANETAFRRAVESYEKLIDTLHAMGYEAVLCGMTVAIYDVIDGDEDLQRVWRFAALPPYNWDWAIWMVYRSDPWGAVTLNSYYVYRVSKLARDFVPIRSEISLGVTGTEVYSDLGEIIHDIRIAKALGFSEVILFLYELFVKAFGLEGLKKLVEVKGESGVVFVPYDYTIEIHLVLFIAQDAVIKWISRLFKTTAEDLKGSG